MPLCCGCSLRHPNVVFVYGVVVPPLEHSEAGENGDGGEQQPPASQGAGMVRAQRNLLACLVQLACSCLLAVRDSSRCPLIWTGHRPPCTTMLTRTSSAC